MSITMGWGLSRDKGDEDPVCFPHPSRAPVACDDDISDDDDDNDDNDSFFDDDDSFFDDDDSFFDDDDDGAAAPPGPAGQLHDR